MSILPKLERDLHAAAERRLDQRRASAEAGTRLRRPARRSMRVVALVACALLGMSAIALAASSLIPNGKPVHTGPLNPRFGNGVPQPGASRLLPLRVPDPDGGLPWGMRVVHTTRGYVCIEVGRVQHGELGELGIDGAFRDDGRFHPIPVDALPSILRSGLQPTEDGNTGCFLSGKAVAAESVGMDRSVGALADPSAAPARHLRDVSYGLLGPNAVSVTYRAGGAEHTLATLPGLGAYLIVGSISKRDKWASGGASIGTYGDLSPRGTLTEITYRVDGRLCERWPVQPPWSHVQPPRPCPQPHWPTTHARELNLHRPLRVHLDMRGDLITGADVSFTAPYAITSARYSYSLLMPLPHCGLEGGGYNGYDRTERDIARGATLHFHLSDPFAVDACARRTATLEVVYEQAEGGADVIVGRSVLRQPAGTRLQRMPRRPRLWSRDAHAPRRH